jgi:hypothetical protein
LRVIDAVFATIKRWRRVRRIEVTEREKSVF